MAALHALAGRGCVALSFDCRLATCLALAWLPFSAVHAQPYGLESRPAAPPFLNMPTELPTPNGEFMVELAFPNLTVPNPTFLTHAPGTNQLYVLEREGRIYSFQNDPGTSTKTLVLDISAQTQGWDDCGLLGMAFHPQFGTAGSPNRGYFYIIYQYTDSPVPGPSRPPATTPTFNRLSRFTVPDGSFVANPATELVLVEQHDRNLWHLGAAMFFHPVDGFLYFTMGDEGGSNDTFANAQRIDGKLFAGVFRIDVDMRGGSISHPIRRQPLSFADRPSFTQNYYIPNDNPWQDPGGGVLEEFYALGLRSPHRMTHDAITDQILLGEVGQQRWEEVNIVEPGSNFQWPYKEGFHDGPRSRPASIFGTEAPPIYEYPHGTAFPFNGNCVIGGHIYRGSAFPDLYGQYIFGDNTVGRIWAMDLSANPPAVSFLCEMPSGSNYTGLSSIGVDKDGELYFCKMGHTNPGLIYKLTRDGSTGSPVPPVLSQTGAFADVANLIPVADLIPYGVGSPLYSDRALKSRWVAIPNTGAGAPEDEQIVFRETGEWDFPAGTVFVKHFELVDDEVTGSTTRLETRLVVVKNDGTVYGVTYKWRADQLEADLLLDGREEDITVTTASGSRIDRWSYPSASDCLTCHNASANFVLGVNTRQLNNDLHYSATGVTDNQLRSWNHIGLFDPALSEAAIPTYLSVVSLGDTAATLEDRVRSYLDANCGHCHRPGQVQGFFDARYDTPLAEQGIIDGPVGNDLGISGAAVVRPSDVARSILHVRDDSLDPAIKMPPLAKNTIHQEWISTLEAWINSLGGLPPLAPPDIIPAGGNFDSFVDVSLSHAEPGVSMFYTLDGTAPTTASTPYTGAFTLTSSATVTAFATKAGFADSTAASATFEVTNFRAPDNPSNTTPGVEYEQFLGEFTALPDFDAETPAEVGIRSNFAIAPRLQDDLFAFRFRGFIDIPETAEYTFYTLSDDGSQLFIGDQLVVDNDLLHSPRESSGQIGLEAGLHSITVTFFERTGGERLDVLYESANLAKTLVPDAALFHSNLPATVFLDDLTVVYDGQPVSMSATTDPPGLAVDITYDGSTSAPTDAGVYSVVATVNDPDYYGVATAILTIEQALATVTLGNLTQTFDGAPKPVTVTTSPPDLVVSVTYDGVSQVPSAPGSYSVLAEVIETNYTGSTSGTLVIEDGNATVTLSGLSQVYDGTPRVVTATTSPPGLAVDITYDGSSTPPTNSGSYTVVATIIEAGYIGSTSGTLVVQPAAAIVSLTNLNQVYDGSPRIVAASTSPSGLSVSVTYDGSSTPPTAAGSYAVAAAITDSNYTGSAAGTLNVAQATATVTLHNLTQTFTGTPRVVTATTAPSGLAVSITYDGSTTAPIDVGSYAVAATVTDPNYAGSATGTLTVTAAEEFRAPENPSNAAPQLRYEQFLGFFSALPDFDTLTPVDVGLRGNFSLSPRIQDDEFLFRFEGFIEVPETAHYTFYTTSDDGSQLFIGDELVVDNDLVHSPRERSGQIGLQAGLHAITVTFFERGGGQVLEVRYESDGIAKTLIPDSALFHASSSATVSIDDLTVVYSGQPVSMSATTDPPGLAVDITYNGSSLPPTDAGVYSVVATINDPDYQGTAAATLTIEPATATVTLADLSQSFDGAPKPVTATTSPAGLAVSLTYDGSTQPPSAVGSYAVVATVIEPNYVGSATGTLTVTAAEEFRAPENPSNTAPQLRYEQFLGFFSALPDFDTLTPVDVGLRSNFSLSPRIQDDEFLFRFEGFIEVPETAHYTFYTTSDDGSQLFIGDELVVDNDLVHSPRERSGQIGLQAGLHAITVTFFERGGGQVLEVRYESDGIAKTLIPDSALFHASSSATVSIDDLTVVYSGQPVSMSATTSPPGLAVDITYNGSPLPPTDVGVYSVVATINDPDHQGSATATLTIEPATATVTLADLSQTFDGEPKPVTATTSPPGLAVSLTYDGSTQAPSAAGAYSVLAEVVDANYIGSATGTLVIDGGSATVTLSGLSQVYDGTPRIVTATTSPPGLLMTITYDGSTTPPINTGSYAVVATIIDPDFTGSSSGTLVVQPAAASVVLANLSQVYDGSPRPVTVATSPTGLSVSVTYDGSPTPPTAAGSYAVSVSITDSNYTGSASGTLDVAKATAAVALHDLVQPFTGTPRVVTATTTPSGLTVVVTYDGSTTAPVDPGTYTVVATVVDNNYTGSANGILTVEGILAETGVVGGISTETWTTVTLSRTYTSMVVVCTPVTPPSSVAILPRVRTAAGNSFELKLANVDAAATPVNGISVHYFVIEEGAYTVGDDGVKMEAVKFVSTTTDHNATWQGEQRSYANTYSNPVVVGQVMTANDASFSVFWCRGNSRNSAPNGSELFVGKHVGEDPRTTRANETIGYIVIEAGTGEIGALRFAAGVGDDSIRGVDNAPPYAYAISGGIASASSAVVSLAGMGSTNGGWAVLYGPNPVTTTHLNLAVDEDQLQDLERRRGTERAGYIVFE